MDTSEVGFEVGPRDGSATRLAIAYVGGEEAFRDRLDVNRAKARVEFAKAVAELLRIDPSPLIARCHSELPRLADAADRVAAQQAAQQGNDDPSESITPPWPEPWPEPVTLKEVLDATLEAIHRHVVLSKEAGIATTLWVAWTYAVDRSPTGPAGDIAPILTIVSPVRRCGKTQLLSVLAYLCPRVVPASNISPSALFRLVEAEKPTLLIDEADAFLRDNEPLRCLLNAGHRRDGAYVVRCVEGDHEFIPRRFSVWTPKSLAMIGSPASTILDRSIVIRLQRKRRDEVVERLNAAAVERLREIARRLMAAVTPEVRAAMYAADPEIPAVLNDRQSDNWRGLLSLADLAGGHWPAAARNAAIVLSVADDPDAESIGILAIGDALAVFGDDDRLTPSELVERLVDLPDRPWAKFARGVPITTKKLASLLAPYSVVARKGTGGTRHYFRLDFQVAFSRYSDTPPETICHSATLEHNPLSDNDLQSGGLKNQSATHDQSATTQVQDWQGFTSSSGGMADQNGGIERFEL